MQALRANCKLLALPESPLHCVKQHEHFSLSSISTIKANEINIVIKIITRALMEGMKCRARFMRGVSRWGLRPRPYLRSLSLRTLRALRPRDLRSDI